LGLAILAVLVSRAVASNISHDENQFIAPGQFLAYDGLLPYLDYPYTHMPYAIPFYALSALASDYDLLAGRLLSVFFWFGSIVLMAAIGRRLSRSQPGAGEGPRWTRLMWEFALLVALLQDATMEFVLRAALNHSLATFFSLMAVLFLVRGIQDAGQALRAAFWSGVFIAAAGLTRFNYASLVAVLFIGWLIHGIQLQAQARRTLTLRFGAGVLMASLPALVLAAIAPRQVYYGNIVYIRLNTVYYELILHRTGMDLASKLSGFGSVLWAEPMQALLYGVLIFTVAATLVVARRDRRRLDAGRLTIAAAAVTLWTTAFAPTPLLLQYLSAPLPFLLVLLAGIEIRLPRFEPAVRRFGALVVIGVVSMGLLRHNPIQGFDKLAHPDQWPPVQVHELSVNIRQLVPEGKVLGLQSMVPLEAGLDAYGFTATGPFSWRTSLLLTPARRGEYHVTSPEELPALLKVQPPEAILVGFEEPNPGFERKDMGGLETPFSEFAASNGYRPERLQAPFWPRGLTLWIRP
jgi:hypothetical protein